jgi:6-phosphogluconolactonase
MEKLRTMNENLLEFDSIADLDLALAQKIKNLLNAAIDNKGDASIAFSGGSTPIGMFKALSTLGLDWSKIFVTLVDERYVPEDHSASNTSLLKKHLFNNEHQPTFYPLAFNAECENAIEAAAKINTLFSSMLPTLDVAVLGMGGDGHTASFFPGSPQLESALDMQSETICMMTEPTNAEHDRLTLTLPYLLKSDQLILHFTGSKKYEVYKQAIDSGLNQTLPVSYILHQNLAPLTIYYADK